MIYKKVQLKKSTSDVEYTNFCNRCEKQKVFMSCGNCDDKWIMVKFEDKYDFLAWILALGNVKFEEIK